MSPESRDSAYLWDMLDAARTLAKITSGMSLDQYRQDRVTQLAVERLIEIIGEAARRVSDTFKQAHPEIPWQPIIGQRNVLAHEYGEISHFQIWKVVTTHIHDLSAKLEPLIPPLPPETP